MKKETIESIEGTILLLVMAGCIIYGFTYWVDRAYEKTDCNNVEVINKR